MVNAILDVSKIQSGDFSIQTYPVNLNDILDAVATVGRRLATEHGLGFDLHMDGKYTVDAELHRLRQVFINLVENAVQYTDSGKVKIFTLYDYDTNEVRVSISDTGSGLDISLDNLFVPFVRGEKGRGTGLGLPLAHGLVSSFNGRIEVDSSSGGSTFTVVLPATANEKQADVQGGLFSLCVIDAHPPMMRNEKDWSIHYATNGRVPTSSLYVINVQDKETPPPALYPNLIYTKTLDGSGYSPGIVSVCGDMTTLSEAIDQEYYYALIVGDSVFFNAVKPLCGDMTTILSDANEERVSTILRHGDALLIIKASDLGNVGELVSRVIVVADNDAEWGELRDYLAKQAPNDYKDIILDSVWEFAV